MNKLTKSLFARQILRDAIPFRMGEEAIPVRCRARPALLCVWTPDPETGRLICTWKRPTDENNSATQDAEEPLPALQMAA